MAPPHQHGGTPGPRCKFRLGACDAMCEGLDPDSAWPGNDCRWRFIGLGSFADVVVWAGDGLWLCFERVLVEAGVVGSL